MARQNPHKIRSGQWRRFTYLNLCCARSGMLMNRQQNGIKSIRKYD